MNRDEKLVLEGGKTKLLCGTRQLDAKAQSGIICDYLRFTFKREWIPDTSRMPADSDDQNLARHFALVFAEMLGFVLGVDRPGRDYYEYTMTIENVNGHEVASVSAGGEGQRGTICFTLKGEGCTNAAKGWEKRVHAYFGEFRPTITRIDLAKDFFEGELSIEEVVGLYKDHEFSYRNRRPKHQCHGAWGLGVDDMGILMGGDSRTFQVGTRESGKTARFYEKGHQFKIMESKWLRAEVELRNAGRVIPWDALVEAGDYYAGAYPALHLIANRETAIKVPTAMKTAELSVEKVVRWVERVVMPTMAVFAMVMPDEEWLIGAALEHSHRRMPRGLRGLNLDTMSHGIRLALRKFTNPGEPAAVGA